MNSSLTITRLVEVPAENLYRGWTEPELLKQWFTPSPWKTVDCEIDLRPGGAFNTVMQGPQGESVANQGCWLEVVPNRKLVFTDAFQADFVPGKPFMVATVSFEPEDGKVRYTARARHWSEEDRDKHEQMGFVDGWNKALDQLIPVASALKCTSG